MIYDLGSAQVGSITCPVKYDGKSLSLILVHPYYTFRVSQAGTLRRLIRNLRKSRFWSDD